MMVSKGITLLAQTAVFNGDIQYWRRQTTDQKTWAHYKLFPHRAHREHRRAVTTSVKGGYTAAVQNIYGILPPPPEDHHEEINDIQTIVQVMHTQSYDLEGLAQANAVLTSSNSALMAQLAQITVTMNSMQAQLNTLTYAQNNQARSNRKH